MEGGRIALAVSRFGVLAIASLVSVAGVTGCAEMDPAGPDVDPDITTTTQAIGEMKCASIAFTPVNRKPAEWQCRLCRLGKNLRQQGVHRRGRHRRDQLRRPTWDWVGPLPDWADPVPTSEKAC